MTPTVYKYNDFPDSQVPQEDDIFIQYSLWIAYMAFVDFGNITALVKVYFWEWKSKLNFFKILELVSLKRVLLKIRVGIGIVWG